MPRRGWASQGGGGRRREGDDDAEHHDLAGAVPAATKNSGLRPNRSSTGFLARLAVAWPRLLWRSHHLTGPTP